MNPLPTLYLNRAAVRALIVTAILSFPPYPAAAQQAKPPRLTAQVGIVNSQAPDPAVARLEKEAEKQRNLKRQKDIQRDSERLLELATELKQYVDKTNENIISLDVIRKAEQIEKLAKSVKDKMKQ